MMRRTIYILLLMSLVLGTRDARARKEEADPGVLLRWNGLTIQGGKSAILVAPGSQQVIGFIGKDRACNVEAVSCNGVKCQTRGGEVLWRAPSESGNYWLQVKLELACRGEEAETVNVRIAGLVGFPGSLIENGFINGFELGLYPDSSKMKHPAYYKPPAFFYYLDYDVMGCWITETIRLGDLGYDGRAPLPQYFALRLELPQKLEAMRKELKSRGLPSRIHYIGGGYISPKSNVERTSKNGAAAELSRHQWGEAVDFIIDEDRDGTQDDMNRDGVIDVRDCFVIRDLVTRLEENHKVEPGGFGVYSPPRHSMLQMHLDVRGFPTRWGYKVYDPNELTNTPPQKSLRPGSG